MIAYQIEAIELETALGRYDAALARVDAVLSRISRKDHWLMRRGDVLMKAGRVRDAKMSYETALSQLEALPLHRRSTPASQALLNTVKIKLNKLEKKSNNS